MKKVIKILFIISILLIAYTYICNVYASGINMNLSNNADSTTYGSSSTNTSSTGTNTSTTTSTQQNTSATISSTSENVLDSLTLSDMINIVLCAIGIILILLGIAIIIRQKSV